MFRSRKGFTLVELMIVVAIGGIILFLVLPLLFIPGALRWVDSQSITNEDPVTFLQEQGETDVYVIQEYRWDPEDDAGCVDADKAGFRVHISADEYTLGEVWVCCSGDFNAEVNSACRRSDGPF